MTDGALTLVTPNVESLLNALPIEPGSLRSHRIFKGTGASMVRICLDAGQVMKEHTAAAPIVVQVLSGRSAFLAGEQQVDLPAGAIIHLDAHIPHAVEAVTPVHLLLILCDRVRAAFDMRAADDGPPRAEAAVDDDAGARTSAELAGTVTGVFLIALGGLLLLSALIGALRRSHGSQRTANPCGLSAVGSQRPNWPSTGPPALRIRLRTADRHRSLRAVEVKKLVGPVGLEPTTHGLKVRCSSQLS